MWHVLVQFQDAVSSPEPGHLDRVMAAYGTISSLVTLSASFGFNFGCERERCSHPIFYEL